MFKNDIIGPRKYFVPPTLKWCGSSRSISSAHQPPPTMKAPIQLLFFLNLAYITLKTHCMSVCASSSWSNQINVFRTHRLELELVSHHKFIILIKLLDIRAPLGHFRAPQGRTKWGRGSGGR